MSSTMQSPEGEVFRHNYQRHLAEVKAGRNPTRNIIDALRDVVSSEEGDQISYEVEQELGVPATNPKLGN